MSKARSLAMVTLVVVFCGASGCRLARSHDREVQSRAIFAVMNEQQDAWNRGDVDGFMAGYWRSPDLTLAGSGGVTRGWDQALSHYKAGYPGQAAMGQLSFSEQEIRFLSRNSALVLGKWHLRREIGDLSGIYTLVFQRFPEGWRIIHDHTSGVAAAK